MTESVFASVALHLDERDPYARWYREALEQIGLHTEPLGAESFGELRRHSTLLLCGRGRLETEKRSLVEQFVARGGSLVVCGGTWGLDSILGVRTLDNAPRFGKSTLVPVNHEDRLWAGDAKGCRFVGGPRVADGPAQVVARALSGEPLVSRNGRCFFLGFDFGLTASHFVLGCSVEQDGLSPGDGTVVLDDGVPRAEDGVVLDYEQDRTTLEDGSLCFDRPYVDWLRHIWARAVVEAVEVTGKLAFLFWPWPNNAPAVACLSLECDDLRDELVSGVHHVLSRYGMPAAWMVAMPGYGRDASRSLIRWGQEVGLLHPLEGRATEEALKIQMLNLARNSGVSILQAVKNSDGRWDGRDRYYDQADYAGARVSLNKGGRQRGNAGFAFGTAQPYSMTASGVTEIPHQLFALGSIASAQVAEHLLRITKQVHGCAHAVSSPILVNTATGRSALIHFLLSARELGMAFMRPSDIWTLDKARRRMRLRVGEQSLQLVSDYEVEGFTVLVAGGEMSGMVKGRRQEPNPVPRYGALFTPFLLDLEQKAQCELVLRLQDRSPSALSSAGSSAASRTGRVA